MSAPDTLSGGEVGGVVESIDPVNGKIVVRLAADPPAALVLNVPVVIGVPDLRKVAEKEL